MTTTRTKDNDVEDDDEYKVDVSTTSSYEDELTPTASKDDKKVDVSTTSGADDGRRQIKMKATTRTMKIDEDDEGDRRRRQVGVEVSSSSEDNVGVSTTSSGCDDSATTITETTKTAYVDVTLKIIFVN